MENVFLLNPDDASHMDIFPAAMADVHIDCVMNSHTIASFLPPLSREKIIAYYVSKAGQISSGVYSIVTEWVPIDSRNPPSDKVVVWQGKELAGFVMLHRTPSETGPFRASVEKLLVSSRFRNRGVARRVMAKLDDEARRTESWLLVGLVDEKDMDSFG